MAVNYRLLLPFAGITLFKFQGYFLRLLNAVFNCVRDYIGADDNVNEFGATPSNPVLVPVNIVCN